MFREAGADDTIGAGCETRLDGDDNVMKPATVMTDANETDGANGPDDRGLQ